MKTIPINTDELPNLLLDLIYNLKVKDVMTSDVITATKKESLRSIQLKMKENGMTGVPIAEEKRLLGIISTDDIIQALDDGYIDEPAEKWMSRNLKMLEDDMPLSYGISFFQKYTHSRFPVVNKNRELVGIITSHDIISSLLLEINKMVQRLERDLTAPQPDHLDHLQREYAIIRHDFENAGKASTELKKLLKSHGIEAKLVRRIAIATYELEMNIIVHSKGGKIFMQIDQDHVQIIASDNGPGIADTNLALEEGYSTANEWIRSLGFGAGMGLPNVKRVSDEFTIESTLDIGTTVKSLIYLTPQGE